MLIAIASTSTAGLNPRRKSEDLSSICFQRVRLTIMRSSVACDVSWTTRHLRYLCTMSPKSHPTDDGDQDLPLRSFTTAPPICRLGYGSWAVLLTSQSRLPLSTRGTNSSYLRHTYALSTANMYLIFCISVIPVRVRSLAFGCLTFFNVLAASIHDDFEVTQASMHEGQPTVSFHGFRPYH